jgi:tetratricopeptide (TPR) repeat protein
MKQLKLSFLFFYFGVISFLFFIPNTIFGQTEIDSAQLYYNAIWYPQESKASINSAVHYFENQSDKFLTINDTISAVNSLRSVTEGYFKIGAIFDSELAAVNGFKLLDNIPLDSLSKKARARLSNHLGRLYRRISDYDSSIKYFNYSLGLSETSIDSISVMNNLANIYTDQEKYYLAVNTFNLVYKKVEKLSDYKSKWTVIDNLGYVQSKLDIPGALNKMQLALNMRLAEQDMEGAFSSYWHLTYYYLDRNNKTTAIIYANKAKKIADSLNSPSYDLEVLSLKALLHDDPNMVELQRLSDSFTKSRQLRDIKYANKKYNNEKLIKENANKQLILLEERNKKNIYLTFVLLAVLGIIFLFFYDKQQNKIGRINERYLTEERISKKIHDELANDVFQVMTQLQNTPKANEKAIDDLEQIYSKTRGISLEYSSSDIKGDFREVLQDLLLSYNNDTVNVITKGITKVDWKSVSEIRKTTIYKVLQELMINMKKHSQASVSVLSFSQVRKKISISYNDNGIGCVQKKNTGLINVENRISSIKGSIIFESEINKGFKVKITV